MSKAESGRWQAQRELEWRHRVTRQAASRQSIAAFCRSEGVAEGTFYGWQARFRKEGVDVKHTECVAEAPGSFIDIGTVKSRDESSPATVVEDIPSDKDGKIEVRIDLGHGVMLQIVRR
jgi:hypothetical protein